jgi:hypothetical protein
MLSFDFPQICTTCRGYKTMPLGWNSTAQPPMCTCPKVSLSWECHRCGKINAPWKGSCDCTPTPFSNLSITGDINAPTIGNTQPYASGPNPFNHYFPDPKGPTTINCDSLNKNFTDK